MDTKKYVYTDPTGGGEDAVLELPVWAEPASTIPANISVVDIEADEGVESDDPNEARPPQEEVRTTQVVYFELDSELEE